MKLREKLMHKYALSRQGAKDLIKGVIACTLQDIAFMIPVTLLYLFVKDLLANSLKGKALFYVIGAVVCLLIVALVTYFQYNCLHIFNTTIFFQFIQNFFIQIYNQIADNLHQHFIR